jgi:hypothetical protein
VSQVPLEASALRAALEPGRRVVAAESIAHALVAPEQSAVLPVRLKPERASTEVHRSNRSELLPAPRQPVSWGRVLQQPREVAVRPPVPVRPADATDA